MSVGQRRLGLVLLALALVAAVVLGAQDASAPWENSFKGVNGGAYATRFIQHHLELGLGVTRGGNVVSVDPHDGRPIFYLNHPGTYALLHVAPAAVFGPSEATVRLVALLLWLPAIPAFWWLARRLLGEPAGATGALLLACTPMTAYYGPMANTDGALLAATLTVAAAYLARMERPTRGNGALLVAALVYAVLLDWSAVWLAPLLGVLALATADARRGLRLAGRLLLLALVPTAALLVHTAVLRGSLARGLGTWTDFLGFSQGFQQGRGPLAVVVAGDAVALFGPMLLALAALGVGVALLAPRAWGLRRPLAAAVALTLPGLLHVLAFRGHARVHDYWSMAATPGLVLAATLPLGALLRTRDGEPRMEGGRSLPRRIALAALVCACGWAAWWGAATTRERTTSNATTFYRDLGQGLNASFGAGDVVATSIAPAAADAYAKAALVGPVDTLAKLKALRHAFSPPGFQGQLAFLLPARERDSELGRALARITTAETVSNGLLFRLTP